VLREILRGCKNREKGVDSVSQKRWGDSYRTTTVCVDSYEKNVPVGRFYNQHYPEGIGFYGAIDLVKKIEAMLDEMSFPQSFSAIRSFAGKPLVDLIRQTDESSYKGKVATFSVKVLFRQNTSWQGSVSWFEGKREETFRSVLELLLLMDSAASTDISR
jgi:hypothetical protein